MPEPTDRIILELNDGAWGYRYAPPPTHEDGSAIFGYTTCCNRMIVAPGALLGDAQCAVAPRILLIDDCCDRPFPKFGHKPVELPPYTGEHATCRKCGSKAVETKFSTAAKAPYGIPPAGYPAEWLHRRCVVCGAEWDEATIPPEPQLYTFGLRNPHELSSSMGRPYVDVPAHDLFGAWRALVCLRVPHSGDELVRRDTPTGPWEVVGRVNAYGGLADG